MKKLLFLLLIISFGAFASNDTLKIKDSTFLEIKDGKEIFQGQTDLLDKYMGGIIALITVISSAYISYKIARHQTQKQEEINERQIQTQIDIAKQQLELNNRQLEEQSRIAIESIRANNISEARIQWIQELRPLLSKLIAETSQIANTYKDIEEFLEKDKLEIRNNLTQPETERLQSLAKNNLKLQEEFENTFSQIKLFLNRNEKEHKDLLDIMKEFINNSKEELRDRKFKNNLNTESLIAKAQMVLKNAWEQAKNEGK